MFSEDSNIRVIISYLLKLSLCKMAGSLHGLKMFQILGRQLLICKSFLSLQNDHYENTPIQIYWKLYHEKMKIFK